MRKIKESNREKPKNVQSTPKALISSSRNIGLSRYGIVPWITEMFQQTLPIGRHVILATLLFIATLTLSCAIAVAVLIRLPPDYFHASHAEEFGHASRGILFWVGMGLKNLLGAILIVLGALLSLPGIPGQGLITLLAGILLLDFPGRRSLLHKILGRPRLLRSINRLRAKFSQPPLVVD